MNEKRMKTSVNTGELSLPSTRADVGGQKLGAEHGGGSEKGSFGVKQGLKIRAMGGQSQKRQEKLNLMP